MTKVVNLQDHILSYEPPRDIHRLTTAPIHRVDAQSIDYRSDGETARYRVRVTVDQTNHEYKHHLVFAMTNRLREPHGRAFELGTMDWINSYRSRTDIHKLFLGHGRYSQKDARSHTDGKLTEWSKRSINRALLAMWTEPDTEIRAGELHLFGQTFPLSFNGILSQRQVKYEFFEQAQWERVSNPITFEEE